MSESETSKLRARLEELETERQRRVWAAKLARRRGDIYAVERTDIENEEELGYEMDFIEAQLASKGSL